MATTLKSLTDFSDVQGLVSSNFIIGIVKAEWNKPVTNSLQEEAQKCLEDYGIKKQNILNEEVPGSFELPLGAQFLLENYKIDAIICLGCLIKGDTPHFDVIAYSLSQTLMDLGIKYNKPVIFGVLTTNNLEQAELRSAKNDHNKGREAAMTAIKMAMLAKKLKKN